MACCLDRQTQEEAKGHEKGRDVTRIVIIGGGTAGLAAATRASRINPSATITVLEAGDEFSRATCSLPYYVNQEILDREHLIGTTTERLAEQRILLKLGTKVQAIDSKKRCVLAENGAHPYDRLIVTTGSKLRPVPMTYPHQDHPRLWALRSLADADRLQAILRRARPRRVAVVGGGYLGLELTEVLTLAGCHVTLLHRGSTLMRLLPACHELVLSELQRRGVEVFTECEVTLIDPNSLQHTVEFQHEGLRRSVGFEGVMLTPGILPNATLLAQIGARCGKAGGVLVDRRGSTSIDGIFAAGDGVELPGKVRGDSRYTPLATSAARLGRVCGENAAGGSSYLPEDRACISSRFFDLQISTVGHPEDWQDAQSTIVDFGSTYSPFLKRRPGRALMLTNPHNGRLVGAQFVAPEAAALADLASLALQQELTLAQLEDLDYCYTPPLSSLWHPFYLAARSSHHRLKESS